jgi:hypothetical protein
MFLSFALVSQYSEFEFKQVPVYGSFLASVHSPMILPRFEPGQDTFQPIAFRLLILGAFFAAEQLIDRRIAQTDLSQDVLVNESYGYGHLVRKVLFYLHKLLLCDMAILGVPLLAKADTKLLERPRELLVFSAYGCKPVLSQAS